MTSETIRLGSRPSSPPPGGEEGREPIHAVPVRHWGQVIAVVVIAIFLANLIMSVATSENLDWRFVLSHLTAEAILRGLGQTLLLSVIAMVIATVVGVAIALARMSGNRVLVAIGWAYVWFFRAVPLVVQIVLWANLALLFKNLSIGIPFTDIVFVQAKTSAIITPFIAVALALALHEAAYIAEIVRGGILSVSKGQREAALALGMTEGLTMRRIILPQTLRTVIPPLGNVFIILIKSSSLASVVAGGELMSAALDMAYQSFRVVESLLVATFWYLVIVSILSVGQWFLERRAARGYR